MRGRNPIGFRPRFLWSGVGVPDFIIFDIVLNRLRLGKLGTSARFLSAFTIFAEDGRRFGNLCVQARTIALTFHYLCRVSWVRILFANGDPISRDSRLGIERFGTSRLGFLPKCGDCLQDVINGKTMRYFIELRYNGGAYCGWQRQPDMPSVQQTIEGAISTLLREPILLTGAGRTDTGVNASYYVAHFDTSSPVADPEQVVFKLNHMLPGDIAVSRIVLTPVSAPGSGSTATISNRARIPLHEPLPGNITYRWTWRQ